MVMLNRDHRQAVGKLDLCKFALIIAVERMQSCYRSAAQPQITSIVKLDLGSSAIRYPYLRALSQRQVLRSSCPIQAGIGSPGYGPLKE
jgi:hypothetical protein